MQLWHSIYRHQERRVLEGLQVVILCGGLGTRLREETEFKPKPMVEIGKFPILWHIMKGYSCYGIRDFVLCLGYRGDVIRDYFRNYGTRASDTMIDLATGELTQLGRSNDHVDWRVILAETGLDSQTGRRMRLVNQYIRGDTFLATYGDGVSDVDISALLSHHRASGKLATVTAVHPSSRFGELTLNGDEVHSFVEKPQVASGWINGGFFVFEKAAFAAVAPAGDGALETDVLARLAAIGQLSVYRHEGFWQCMDTYREMSLLNDMWASGAAPWRKW